MIKKLFFTIVSICPSMCLSVWDKNSVSLSETKIVSLCLRQKEWLSVLDKNKCLSILNIANDFKKGDPTEIFWKYFQNKWFSWSYKTTNLTEKWRNCWVFWRKSRYFDWFKYGFSITPTEFITYFQNISAGSPFLKSLFRHNFSFVLWLFCSVKTSPSKYIQKKCS